VRVGSDHVAAIEGSVPLGDETRQASGLIFGRKAHIDRFFLAGGQEQRESRCKKEMKGLSVMDHLRTSTWPGVSTWDESLSIL
jgi:hypothetical protein